MLSNAVNGCFLLAASLLLVACQVADVGLGRQLLAQGNKDAALLNFQTLAEKNIPEAQVAVGNLQALSHNKREQASAVQWYRKAAPHSERAKTQLGKLLARTKPKGDASLIEAEHLLKSALERGDNSALPPLMQLYVSYGYLWPGVQPDHYIAKAKAIGMPQAYIAEIELFRRRGQYQQHWIDIEKTCQTLLAVQPACYAELVAVQRSQKKLLAIEQTVAATKTAFTLNQIDALSVDRVARALVSPEYPIPQPQMAKSLLELIVPTYPDAWLSLARLQVQFSFLGDADSLQKILDKAIANGSIDAHLIYGDLLMTGKVFPMNPSEAYRHLSVAAPYLPKAEYLLGSIYKEGLLGEAEPSKAFPLLLSAARRGASQADLALARMFSESKGVKPQLEYAWAFASLANEKQHPGAPVLLSDLNARLPASRLLAANTYYLREKSYRSALPSKLENTQEDDVSSAFTDSDMMTTDALPKEFTNE